MKELYGFSEGNLEYIPKSGELLRYIGTEVALLEYTKDKTDEGSRAVDSLLDIVLEDILKTSLLNELNN